MAYENIGNGEFTYFIQNSSPPEGRNSSLVSPIGDYSISQSLPQENPYGENKISKTSLGQHRQQQNPECSYP